MNSLLIPPLRIQEHLRCGCGDMSSKQIALTIVAISDNLTRDRTRKILLFPLIFALFARHLRNESAMLQWLARNFLRIPTTRYLHRCILTTSGAICVLIAGCAAPKHPVTASLVIPSRCINMTATSFTRPCAQQADGKILCDGVVITATCSAVNSDNSEHSANRDKTLAP